MGVRFLSRIALEVTPETVGQFTGLLDKHGIEIFEGDIVEAWSAGSCGRFEVRWRQESSPCWILFPAWQQGQMWHLHGSEYKIGDKYPCDGKIVKVKQAGFYDDGVRVLGNVHDNPDMLKRRCE